MRHFRSQTSRPASEGDEEERGFRQSGWRHLSQRGDRGRDLGEGPGSSPEDVRKFMENLWKGTLEDQGNGDGPGSYRGVTEGFI